jgi:hypothetical protein
LDAARRAFVLLIASFLFVNVFSRDVPAATTPSVSLLGEIKASGKVSFKSFNGRWVSSVPSYPLIKDTVIKTEDGTASIYFKDGSKIDIAKETVVVVGGSNRDLSTTLDKGILAFSIKSSTALMITTPTTTISVNDKNGGIQKVSLEGTGRASGVVIAKTGETRIWSLAGRISATISATETKLIPPGEGLLVAPGQKIYKAQIASPGGNGEPKDKVGEVGALMGRASILRYDKSLTAKQKDDILPVDSVETKSASKLKIMFVDDSTVTLGENSKLSVREFLLGDSTKRGKSVFTLIDGRLKAVVGRNGLEIRTRTAVAAARGTVIFVWINEKNETCMAVTEGTGELRNADDSIPGTVEVHKDQMSCVAFGLPPVDPMSIPPALLSELIASTSTVAFDIAASGAIAAVGTSGAPIAGAIYAGAIIVTGTTVTIIAPPTVGGTPVSPSRP